MKKIKLTEEKFLKVKSLITLKVPQKSIAILENISLGTVNRISKTENWVKYVEAKKEWAKTQRAKKENTTESKKALELTPKTFDEHNSIVTVLRAIEFNLGELNATLKEISAKLPATNNSGGGFFRR